MKWFAAVSVLLLLALVFQAGLLAYVVYAVAGILVTSRFLSRAWAEGAEAERECNRLTANVGDKVAVVIRLRNRTRLPIPWLLVEDLFPRHAFLPPPPRLRVEGRRLQLAWLKAHATRTLTYQFTCNQRGYFQIGPLVLETGDLFGLHRRFRVLTEPHFVLVYPEVVPLEGFDIGSRRPIGEVRMSYRLYEDPTRIAGVRCYQPGDPLNRIHWRATARTGTLHSKLYEPSTIAGATIVLDFHQDGYPAEGGIYRSELAITAAASVTHALYEMNQQVGLVTNGRDAADRIRQEGWDYDIRSRQAARRTAGMRESSDRLQPVIVPTQRGAEQRMRILETLARVELTDGLDLVQLVRETAPRIPRDATVLVILPRVTAETAVALGNLRRSGFAVSAILNIFEEHYFAEAAGRLAAEGVDAFQLKDRPGIASICRRYVMV
ncbi:MAG TPA: DUF58 domain-containing protein [Planctomycetaceae bacterium]|nr:DUF58 domain-containing protein [Planctomycetaceae bacterium]